VASANEHEAAGHGDEHAAAGHGDEHAATFDDVNWYFGLLGEKEGLEEPDLLWRPKGMPVPFAALAFDTLLLYYVLYRVFGRGVVSGLRKRKEDILRGMEEAAKMKREAEQQLQSYEEKFGQVDQEVLRIQQQMRKNAEQEHARILQEAKERRERMERDAHVLVQQELKAVREKLIESTIESALKSAEQTLRQRLGDADQQRFGDEYIASIHRAGGQLRGRV
jgi:F-type H+-transporting ATPase subunit b